MEMNDMILVSVDDHVCEPPDMWECRLPAKWESRAPRLMHKKDGTDVWLFEGQQIPNVGGKAVAGRRPEEYGTEPTALRPGCYDVDARIDDVNANGVLGSLCLPTVPGFVGELLGRSAAAGGANRLRPSPPSPLDAAQLPERQEAERRLPRARQSRASSTTRRVYATATRSGSGVALNLLIDRLPNLRLDPEGDDPHIRGQVFRSPTMLPVLFDAPTGDSR